MAKLIAIMGESGSGKTTSLRNLPPEQTFFIDSDMKGLAWKGWRNQYNAQNKNYLRTADQDLVLKILRHVNEREEYKNITYVVIDTLNGIMVSDEFKRMKDKGYDKWVDLATAVWNIIEYAQNMRDEITVICVCHCQTERDDTGYSFARIKTSGRKQSSPWFCTRGQRQMEVSYLKPARTIPRQKPQWARLQALKCRMTSWTY